MIVRGAGVADLAALAALEHIVFETEVYPSFFFRQALDLWPAHLVVAADDDMLAGYALGAPAAVPGEGWLLSLAVHPDQRGRGIAIALAEALVQTFVDAGVSRVVLTVMPGNPAAVRLYERLGFRVEAEEEHYFGPGELRWRMVWEQRWGLTREL
jgi:ribosomal-protein-alanine N-acetyltransferase